MQKVHWNYFATWMFFTLNTCHSAVSETTIGILLNKILISKEFGNYSKVFILFYIFLQQNQMPDIVL